VRLILIALNSAVALGAGLDFVAVDLELTVFDLIGLAIAGTMIALLLGRAARNLREHDDANPCQTACCSSATRLVQRIQRTADSARSRRVHARGRA